MTERFKNKFDKLVDKYAFWLCCGLGGTAMICYLVLIVGMVVIVALNLK